MSTTPFDPDILIGFAAELADAARPIARRYFRTTLDIHSKADESPVTIADRTIEAEIRARIEARFPDHGILGEEMGVKAGQELTWVVDPIDGTKSFVTGLPLFGTLIAILNDDRPWLGLIDMPMLDERWTGGPGGSFLNGEPARTSGCAELAKARIFTTSPEGFSPDDADAFRRLSSGTAVRRYGGDCYSYGLLASGHCDIVAETGLQPYDYFALVPIVEAAGGRITDWDGQDLGLRSDGRVLATASPELHAAALSRLGA